MFKKILSIVLSIAMILTVISVPSFAESTPANAAGGNIWVSNVSFTENTASFDAGLISGSEADSFVVLWSVYKKDVLVSAIPETVELSGNVTKNHNFGAYSAGSDDVSFKVFFYNNSEDLTPIVPAATYPSSNTAMYKFIVNGEEIVFDGNNEAVVNVGPEDKVATYSFVTADTSAVVTVSGDEKKSRYFDYTYTADTVLASEALDITVTAADKTSADYKVKFFYPSTQLASMTYTSSLKPGASYTGSIFKNGYYGYLGNFTNRVVTDQPLVIDTVSTEGEQTVLVPYGTELIEYKANAIAGANVVGGQTNTVDLLTNGSIGKGSAEIVVRSSDGVIKTHKVNFVWDNSVFAAVKNQGLNLVYDIDYTGNNTYTQIYEASGKFWYAGMPLRVPYDYTSAVIDTESIVATTNMGASSITRRRFHSDSFRAFGTDFEKLMNGAIVLTQCYRNNNTTGNFGTLYATDDVVVYRVDEKIKAAPSGWTLMTEKAVVYSGASGADCSVSKKEFAAGEQIVLPVSSGENPSDYFITFKTVTPGYQLNESVTFELEDGTTVSTAQYPAGGFFTVPKDPEMAPDALYTYDFAGWYKKGDETKTVVDFGMPGATTVTGSVTYVAKFTQTYRDIDYTVKFLNWDGDTFAEFTRNPLKDSGDLSFILEGIPTRPNSSGYKYTFAGWAAEGTTTIITPTSVADGDYIYRAQYTQSSASEVTVAFIYEDLTPISSSTYTPGQSVSVPNDPTKEADDDGIYTFVGWYIKGDAAKTVVTPATTAGAADVTYVAKFDVVSRTSLKNLTYTTSVYEGINGGAVKANNVGKSDDQTATGSYGLPTGVYGLSYDGATQSITGFEADKDGKTYSVELPYGAEQIKFAVTANGADLSGVKVNDTLDYCRIEDGNVAVVDLLSAKGSAKVELTTAMGANTAVTTINVTWKAPKVGDKQVYDINLNGASFASTGAPTNGALATALSGGTFYNVQVGKVDKTLHTGSTDLPKNYIINNWGGSQARPGQSYVSGIHIYDEATGSSFGDFPVYTAFDGASYLAHTWFWTPANQGGGVVNDQWTDKEGNYNGVSGKPYYVDFKVTDDCTVVLSYQADLNTYGKKYGGVNKLIVDGWKSVPYLFRTCQGKLSTAPGDVANASNGTVVNTYVKSFKAGETVSIPSLDLTAEGYTAYTYVDPDNKTYKLGQSIYVCWNGDPSYKDVPKYTITFEDWDGTELAKYADFEEGAAIGKPEDPTRAEDTDYVYSFMGWYVKGDDTKTVVTPDSTAIKTVTYVAKYDAVPKTATKYTVKFMSEGSEVSSVTNVKGYPVSAPADPTKASTFTKQYTFAGWYVSTDETKTVVTPVTAIPEQDITYIAKFTESNIPANASYSDSSAMLYTADSTVGESVTSSEFTKTADEAKQIMIQTNPVRDALIANEGANEIKPQSWAMSTSVEVPNAYADSGVKFSNLGKFFAGSVYINSKLNEAKAIYDADNSKDEDIKGIYSSASVPMYRFKANAEGTIYLLTSNKDMTKVITDNASSIVGGGWKYVLTANNNANTKYNILMRELIPVATFGVNAVWQDVASKHFAAGEWVEVPRMAGAGVHTSANAGDSLAFIVWGEEASYDLGSLTVAGSPVDYTSRVFKTTTKIVEGVNDTDLIQRSAYKFVETYDIYTENDTVSLAATAKESTATVSVVEYPDPAGPASTLIDGGVGSASGDIDISTLKNGETKTVYVRVVSKVSDTFKYGTTGTMNYYGTEHVVNITKGQAPVPGEYTVKFMVEGSELTASTVTGPTGTPVVKPADPTKLEDTENTYEFAGWYVESDETKTVVEPVTEIGTENITYVAKFTAVPKPTYTVKFIANGSEITSATVTGVTGTAVTKPADPTKPEDTENTYEFAGWYVESDGTQTVVTPVTSIGTESITYVAKFTAKPKPSGIAFDFEIPSAKESYSAGDEFTLNVKVVNNTNGIGAMAFDTKFDKTKLEVTNVVGGILTGLVSITKVEDANTNGKVNLQHADTTNTTGDGVLVAITFKVRTGAASGDTKIEVVPVEGSQIYYVGQTEIPFDIDAADKTITIAGAPAPTTYTVKFMVDGSEITASTVTGATGTPVSAPADPTKASTFTKKYTFAGWYVSTDETKTVVTPVTSIGTENITYIAKFTEEAVEAHATYSDTTAMLYTADSTDGESVTSPDFTKNADEAKQIMIQVNTARNAIVENTGINEIKPRNWALAPNAKLEFAGNVDDYGNVGLNAGSLSASMFADGVVIGGVLNEMNTVYTADNSKKDAIEALYKSISTPTYRFKANAPGTIYKLVPLADVTTKGEFAFGFGKDILGGWQADAASNGATDKYLLCMYATSRTSSSGYNRYYQIYSKTFEAGEWVEVPHLASSNQFYTSGNSGDTLAIIAWNTHPSYLIDTLKIDGTAAEAEMAWAARPAAKTEAKNDLREERYVYKIRQTYDVYTKNSQVVVDVKAKYGDADVSVWKPDPAVSEFFEADGLIEIQPEADGTYKLDAPASDGGQATYFVRVNCPDYGSFPPPTALKDNKVITTSGYYGCDHVLNITKGEKPTEHTVKFVVEGDTKATFTGFAGTTVTKPADPTKAEDTSYVYTFAGWYVEGDETKTVVEPVTEIGNADITYVAKFDEAAKYTVKFVVEDDTAATFTGTNGTAVTKPADPSKAEDELNTYTFEGWFVEGDETKTVVEPVTEINGASITYVAKFEAHEKAPDTQYTIKFIADGSEITTSTVTGVKGTPVVTPADPTKLEDEFFSYKFEGWYVQGDDTKTAVTPITEIGTMNVTYVAIFANVPKIFPIEDKLTKLYATSDYTAGITTLPANLTLANSGATITNAGSDAVWQYVNDSDMGTIISIRDIKVNEDRSRGPRLLFPLEAKNDTTSYYVFEFDTKTVGANTEFYMFADFVDNNSKSVSLARTNSEDWTHIRIEYNTETKKANVFKGDSASSVEFVSQVDASSTFADTTYSKVGFRISTSIVYEEGIDVANLTVSKVDSAVSTTYTLTIYDTDESTVLKQYKDVAPGTLVQPFNPVKASDAEGAYIYKGVMKKGGFDFVDLPETINEDAEYVAYFDVCDTKVYEESYDACGAVGDQFILSMLPSGSWMAPSGISVKTYGSYGWRLASGKSSGLALCAFNEDADPDPTKAAHGNYMRVAIGDANKVVFECDAKAGSEKGYAGFSIFPDVADDKTSITLGSSSSKNWVHIRAEYIANDDKNDKIAFYVDGSLTTEKTETRTIDKANMWFSINASGSFGTGAEFFIDNVVIYTEPVSVLSESTVDFTAYAEQTPNTNIVTVSGYTVADELVSAFILADGKTKADLKNAIDNGIDLVASGIVYAVGEGASNGFGDFAVELRIPEDVETGTYNIVLADSEGIDTIGEVQYVAAAAQKDAIEKLSKAAYDDDASAAHSALDENAKNIGGKFTNGYNALSPANKNAVSNIITETDALARFYDMYSDITDPDDKEAFYNSNLSDVLNAIDGAVAIGMFNDNDIDASDFNRAIDAIDYAAEDNYLSDAIAVMDSNVAYTAVDSIIKDISGCAFNSYGDFAEAFEEAIFKAAVKTPGDNGNQDRLSAVRAFYDMGLLPGLNVKNAAAITASNVMAASKKSINSFADFVKAYNDVVKANQQIPGGGGDSDDKKESGSVSFGPSYNPPVVDVLAPYRDAKDAAWAHDALEYAVLAGILNGYEDSTLRPNNYATREEVAKMLVGAFVGVKDDAFVDFTDVNTGDWFYKYVATAYMTKIVKGIGEGKFGTGMNITRQDLAVMIYNYLISAGENLDATPYSFNDDAAIRDYAKTAVYALRNAGIINGYADGSFAPLASASRAEIAQIIYNIVNR